MADPHLWVWQLWSTLLQIQPAWSALRAVSLFPWLSHLAQRSVVQRSI